MRATPRVSSSNSQFVATTNEGRTICRSFNSPRGCHFTNCVYERACNRHVQGGKACGQNHPGNSHVTTPSPSQGHATPQ